MAENALKILSDDENLETFKSNAAKAAMDFWYFKVLPLYNEAIYEKAPFADTRVTAELIAPNTDQYDPVCIACLLGKKCISHDNVDSSEQDSKEAN